jgi:hypothetical protein
LCTGADSEPADVSGSTNSYYFTFEFTHKPGGWEPWVYFIDPRDDKPPADLVAGTGYKQIVVYEYVDFEGVVGRRFH